MAIEIKYYSSTFLEQDRIEAKTEVTANTWPEVRAAITNALQHAQSNNHDVLKIKIMRR